MTLRMSHSTINGLLDDCAYRVGLRAIVGLPSPTNGRNAAGTVFHELLEQHERARAQWYATGGLQGDENGVYYLKLVKRIDDLLAQQEADWDADKMTFTEASVMVEHLLENWWNTPIPGGQLGAGGSLRDRAMLWRPLLLESKWTLWLPPLTSLPTVGYIDGTYLDPETGEIVIVDWKSAGSFGKWKLDGLSNRDQASWYILAALKAPTVPVLPGQIPRFEYHIVRTTAGSRKNFQGARVLPIEVDQVDLDWVEQRVERAHQQQLRGEWRKNPSSFFCSSDWCPYWGTECNPTGPPERDIEAYRRLS